MACNKRKKKKGSLALSINAIVVLILAITMLGLGLGFMRKTFGETAGKFEQVSDEMQKEMLQRLSESGDRLALSAIEVAAKRGEEKRIYMAIKNDLGGPNPTSFTVALGLCSAMGGACPSEATKQIAISYYKPVKSLKDGEVFVAPIIFKPASQTPSDTYSYTVYVCAATSCSASGTIYDSKDIFINVV